MENTNEKNYNWIKNNVKPEVEYELKYTIRFFGIPLNTIVFDQTFDRFDKKLTDFPNLSFTTINDSEDWKILKKNIIIPHSELKKEEKMKIQKLSRAGLKEIHSIACSEWKNTLEEWGKNNPLEDYIELTESKVDNMFKSCTSEQLPIVSKYLKQSYNIDLSMINDHIKINGCDLISTRVGGEYKNISFWLDTCSYNWEIKVDDLGQTCLIPTIKEL